jgi:hypothetical protein
MDFPDGFLMKNGSVLLGLRTAPDASEAAADDRFDPNRVGPDPPMYPVTASDQRLPGWLT